MKKLGSTFLITSLVLTATSAHAFTEDICYPADGGIADCTPLPAACTPVGTHSPLCLQASILTYAKFGADYPDARSTIHVDSIYLLAQKVGFSQDDAYWIAAYAEAVDRGTFEPRDEDGNFVGDGGLTTSSITGLERNDFTSGGIFIHFSAPRNPNAAAAVPGIDGLHPDAGDTTHEVVLANLRAWAVAASGNTRPDCAGGLTNASGAGDNATGTTCFANGGSPGNISGSVTLFDGPQAQQNDADIQTFNVATGLQIVQDTDAGQVTSDHFDDIVGSTPAHIADARLAIYIHAYGDRTSHHICLDEGYTYGPTGGDWTANMTNDDCAQGLHTLRHIWETGVDFSQLDPASQTTIAYLGNAYDELAAFAQMRGVANSAATDATQKTAMVTAISAALENPDPKGRLAALTSVACGNGLQSFPGEPACPYVDVGSNGDGGASVGSGDGGGTSSEAGANGDTPGASDSGCSCNEIGSDSGALGSGALLAACVLGLGVSRRKRRR